MSSEFSDRFPPTEAKQDILNSPHTVVIVTEDRGERQYVQTTVIQSISRDISVKTAQGYMGTAAHVGVVHAVSYQMAFSLVNHVNHLPITNDVCRRIADVRELIEQVAALTNVSDALPQATVISLQRYTS